MLSFAEVEDHVASFSSPPASFVFLNKINCKLGPSAVQGIYL